MNTGNDQFFPYISINQKGVLNVTFQDRRLDTTSTASEWPTSRTEPGNYLVWYWGAQCKITQTTTVSMAGTGPGPGRRVAVRGARGGREPDASRPGLNPGAGPVPGNGQNSATLPFRNFQISDWGTNYDYSFRAGLFAGDYTGNTAGPKNPNGDEKGDDQTYRRLDRRPERSRLRRADEPAAGTQPDLRAVGRLLRALRLGERRQRPEGERAGQRRPLLGHALSDGHQAREVARDRPTETRGPPPGGPLRC